MEIDNEVAIEMLKTFREAMDTPITNYRDILLGSLDMAIKALEDKKPNGKWRDYSDEGFIECPFCNSATNCEDNIDELHFCWNCGAELRGEKK